MSELVTGDAVVLGVRPARLPSRALASAIDLAAVFTVFILISVVLGIASAALDEAALAAIMVASFLLVLVGGPVAVETLSHGRSLGKLACGLRVVRDDGGPIRFRHALVRGGMGLVEILMTFGVLASIASLVSARGRRVGDVFAGTLVIRERVAVPGRSVAVPPPPPWLVGRFARLDLSAVPDELWLAVRQYLTRMQQLDPGVGRSIADRLAADLVERTGTAVPQGVPAAAFLAAVLHERQARDARRVFGAAGVGVPVPDVVVPPGGRAAPGGPSGGGGPIGGGAVAAVRAGTGAGGDAHGVGGGGGPAGAGSAGANGGGRGAAEQRDGAAGGSWGGFAPPG
ncbi:RDD family protein [Streptomyces sp. RB110-1]|uniref:RDD family protein n=1 Tax=Streptomyces TaxID=1883 RepID=UPI0018FF8BD2|nr:MULTISPECIES: RDD family protein [Streptomyces]MBK0376652.1 RDD family protein [Streptomyces sp. RB110-1]MBK0386974.1 RDD family protein [Streptomyces sp. RB110-2]MCF3171150.1 RDD family protein [Streptomyces violaceoruber]